MCPGRTAEERWRTPTAVKLEEEGEEEVNGSKEERDGGEEEVGWRWCWCWLGWEIWGEEGRRQSRQTATSLLAPSFSFPPPPPPPSLS